MSHNFNIADSFVGTLKMLKQPWMCNITFNYWIYLFVINLQPKRITELFFYMVRLKKIIFGQKNLFIFPVCWVRKIEVSGNKDLKG